MAARICPLEERHIHDVAVLEKEVHASPWSEQAFRNELKNDPGVFIVAEENGKVTGYAGMWVIVDEAHVINVAVSPERRREGLGRRLMVELLVRAQELRATCSTLEVRASNSAAIQLYEGLGYVSSGVRKRYYPDNREDAVVMWLYGLQEWSTPARQ